MNIRDNGSFVLKLTGMLVVFVGILVGNLAISITYLCSKNLRNLSRFRIIFSLAVADILYAIVVVSVDIVYTLWDVWYFGDWFCTVWRILDVTFSTASFIHLALLAMDQYLNINWTFGSTSTIDKRLRIYNGLICAVWIYSISYSTATLLSCKECLVVLPQVNNGGSVDNGTNIYRQEFGRFGNVSVVDMGYTNLTLRSGTLNHDITTYGGGPSPQCPFNIGPTQVAIFCSSFFVNMTIVITFCSLVIFRLRRYSKQLFRDPNTKLETKQIKVRKVRRAICLLFVMVLLFLLCWLPFFINLALLPYFKRNSVNVPPFIFDLLLWFAYINSAINPILYFFMHYEIRFRIKQAAASSHSLSDQNEMMSKLKHNFTSKFKNFRMHTVDTRL